MPAIAAIAAQHYEPGVGRLAKVEHSGGDRKDALVYDPAGNVRWTSRVSDHKVEDRASYYGADDRPRAIDHRTQPTAADSGSRYTADFEEYRYDALGRRVWVRARRWCQGEWYES